MSSSSFTPARPFTSYRSSHYASPRLWNQLPASFRQPRTSLSNSTSPSRSSCTTCICSIDSPLHHPSPFHYFTPGLKPSFSANPSHRNFPFLLHDLLHKFPWPFADTSEHIRLYFLVFFSFFHFLVVGSVRQIKLTYVAFERTLKLHLVSYRIVCRSQRVNRTELNWPQLHRESKKTRHQTLSHNFTNCYPIFKIFSLKDSVVNLQQTLFKNSTTLETCRYTTLWNMNVTKWHHSEIRIAINDDSQGSIAKNSRCDE